MNKHAVQMLLAALVVLAGVSLRRMSGAMDSSYEYHHGVPALGVAPLPLSPVDDHAARIHAIASPEALPFNGTETATSKLLAMGTSPVPLPPPGTRAEQPRLVAMGTSPVPLPPPGTRAEQSKLVAMGTSPVPLPPPGTRAEQPKLVAMGTSPVPLPPPGTRTDRARLAARPA
jgi:hypothetical protein